MVFPYRLRTFKRASLDESDSFVSKYSTAYKINYYIDLSACVLAMISPVFYETDYLTMPKLLVFIFGLILVIAQLIFQSPHLADYDMSVYYEPFTSSDILYKNVYKTYFYIKSKISISSVKCVYSMLTFLHLRNLKHLSDTSTDFFFALEKLYPIIYFYSKDKKSKYNLTYTLNTPKSVNLIAHLKFLKDDKLTASFFSTEGTKHRQKITKEIRELNKELLRSVSKLAKVNEKIDASSESVKHMQNIQQLESMYSSFDLD